MSEEVTPAEVASARRVKRALVDRNNKRLEKLEVEYVPIKSISVNPYNPNRQSPHDFEMLCRSIATDGFTQPIIVNRSLMQIVDGEHRWRALQELGFDECPVVMTDMTAEQMRISTLRHNRARGKENTDLIIELFKELDAMGATGLAVEELMLDPAELEKLTQLDGDELKGLDLDVTIEELGPNGQGLSELDQRSNIDTTSDERRAREQQLERIKREEEARMGTTDQNVLRLMLIYTGAQAELVKRVLERLAPEGAKEPVPAALLRLCAWAQQSPEAAA